MEQPRIGVYVCWCGTNIAMMVDVKAVAKEIERLPNVVLSKTYKYMCSDPGQDMVIKDIKEQQLNRVVVAACSPRIHEKTFRTALETAGLNPYMLQMANIREQDSWVHTDRGEATEKAKSLIAGAVSRVNHHKPLNKRQVPVHETTLVIGGGISGITAALELADSGKKVILVEKNDKLGGIAALLDLTAPYMFSAAEMIKALVLRVEVHQNIKLYTDAVVKQVTGYVGNFNGKIIAKHKKKAKQVEFGNLVVATGLKPVLPEAIKNYGYGKFKEVITSLEFEHMLRNGNIVNAYDIKPKNVAIIHCVGSRNDDHKSYCSRTCCMNALKYSNLIRSALPESNIYQLYADMRAFGKGCEELYTNTSRRDVMFMMFDQRNNLPVISKDTVGPGVLVTFNEKLSGVDVEVPADMVILMTAMEAQDDAKEISRMAGVSMDANGFFIEKHPKLDPVATTTDGVYVVGNCQSPKDIPDSIAQARAATARILGTISKGYVEVEVITAEVDEEVCCGCQFCILVCPYGANSYDSRKEISTVNEALCKGCGTCGSACPSGAITTKHFTDDQILSQIEGLLAKTHTSEGKVMENELASIKTVGPGIFSPLGGDTEGA